MYGPLSSLATLEHGRTRRISSYDRTGGNRDCITIPAGRAVTIAAINGAGCIRHVWFTINHPDPLYRRALVLRMYWDGEKEPSVNCPVGDFFGQGWGEQYSFISLPLAAAPSNGRALNCYFPMPFARGARIEIVNESAEPCRSFYYYVDYEELQAPARDSGRFHAVWNRNVSRPAQGVENEWGALGATARNLTNACNHVILDARGRGHYVGVNYYVECPSTMWYGEGDDMWFIDGEAWPPSLHGTGTEDYFNSSWCPKEVYMHPYFGYPRVNEGQTGWLGRTHCYRFHIEEPIRFEKSLHGSIEIGHADSLTADVVTVAYWYQAEPHKRMPALPPYAQRGNMPHIGPREIHQWREAFRQAHGGKAVWGNEGLPKALAGTLERKLRKTAKRLAPPAAVRASAAEVRKQKKMLDER